METKQNALKKNVHCWYFTKGVCRFGDACLFRHEIPRSNNEHPACAICLEALRQDRVSILYPCMHKFCTICIREWANESGTLDAKVTCPLCRQRGTQIPLPYYTNGMPLSDLLENYVIGVFDRPLSFHSNSTWFAVLTHMANSIDLNESVISIETIQIIKLIGLSQKHLHLCTTSNSKISFAAARMFSRLYALMFKAWFTSDQGKFNSTYGIALHVHKDFTSSLEQCRELIAVLPPTKCIKIQGFMKHFDFGELDRKIIKIKYINNATRSVLLDDSAKAACKNRKRSIWT
ncbi:hypothetical protein CANCADRAFT_112021 [Tortispora caseinolytica NRRL Y-17796]|uniref:RING-type E3 ubiquitin transferase n=1 Tax=Tortispora caseinolytica NRRL Y-17796 TaxID=767744 RepID=A0A1E4TGF0_9ASCO|nr:hypothetical protein CANCADRAFT_112021 [Tortispora caseinolytica NRRL Y-17796]